MALKRGFNRLYIVLVGLWAIYCLVIFPVQRREMAVRELSEDKQVCYERRYITPDERSECLKLADDTFNSGYDSVSIKNFYVGAWPSLLLVIVVAPSILYWLCQGAAAVSMWIWHGFRVNPPN